MTRSTFRLLFYVNGSKEKNGIVPLLVCSQVKVEKSQVRKVVQECRKLVPASNSLSYTTYQYDYNRECRYSPVRRIGRNITHHFSFGERFDETMMKCYFVCYQHIMLPNHQFIEFSPLNKSAGEVTVVNITIRRLSETKSPPLDFPFASERSSKLSFELPKGLRVIPNSGHCFSMVASLCFGLPKTACYPSRWLKRHFICALILLKLACVMPK